MRTIISLVTVMIVIAFCSSCVVREPVHSKDQLRFHEPEATLVLLLRDGSMLRLPTFALQGDSIVGKGSAEKAGSDSEFSGAVPLDDIEFAQLEETSATGILFIAIPTGVLAGAVLAVMMGDTHVRIEEYTPSSGGSSCPYVYSWDGERYVLEAETFGTSIGSALQRSTRHVLPSLCEENGVVRLKIANERPETHVLDRVAMTRVRHDAGTRVVLDAEGRPWQVGVTAGPEKRIRGTAGQSCTQYVFRRPAGARRALLLITARNCETAKGFFHEVFDYLDTYALRFMRDIERDEETVTRLRAWQRRAALHVTLSGGRSARRVGTIDAEATAVSFTRAVPLELDEIPGDRVSVALDGLPGIWSVEDVRICWDAAEGLSEETLAPVSMTGPAGADIRDLLMEEDGRCCTLLPPQAVELRYRAGKADSRYAWSYCIEAAGYLHLWYQQTGESELFARFALIPKSRRLAFIRSMLDRPDLVYSLLEDITVPQ